MKENYIMRRYSRFMMYGFMGLLLFFLPACGATGAASPSATPTAVRVNGFGTAANHVHSLLALPNHVLLLATHYGIYRSTNDGTSWQQETSGPGQLMQGLMEYSLTASPLNPNQVYTLTLPATYPHAGTLGIYASSDGGQTWKMTIATAQLTSTSIFTAEAGNTSPNELYIYLPQKGPNGLMVSEDGGRHFTSTGALPFGNIAAILAIPGEPGHVLVSGGSGMALSTDGGKSWQTVKNIDGGVYDLTTAGAHSPIYASGDAGIYASQDGGATFTLVDSQASYGQLAVSPAQPDTVYGRTATAIYRSTDGGHTWQPLPHIAGNLGNLAVDPGDANKLYLSLSYPVAVYQLTENGTSWASLTPKA
jgi:photosystem II stability/assembly factor-like uncharacterized protein